MVRIRSLSVHVSSRKFSMASKDGSSNFPFLCSGCRLPDLRSEFREYLSPGLHIHQQGQPHQPESGIGELIPECFGTGISMRLEDTDNTTVRIIACSSQCCSNLCRMMCIIINDSDAAEFSFCIRIFWQYRRKPADRG